MVLLEAELGMGVDAVRGVEQQVGPPVHLVAHLLLQRVPIDHGRTLPAPCGRCVRSSRRSTMSASGSTRQADRGCTSVPRRRRRARPAAAGRTSPARRRTRRTVMAGWGTWVPVGSRRHALTRSASAERRGRRRASSTAPVVGVAPRRHVEAAEELGVHGGDDPAPPPRAPGHEVGHEPVLATVEQHRAEVARQRHGVGTAGVAASPVPPTVRHRSPPRSTSGGTGSSARRARSTTCAGLGVGAGHRRGRQRQVAAPGAPHGWPFSIVTLVAPTSTRRRRRHHAPEQPLVGRRRRLPGVAPTAPPRPAGAAGR